ncbi:hypothetical protein HpBT268_13960 [Helicobacter pylori]
MKVTQGIINDFFCPNKHDIFYSKNKKMYFMSSIIMLSIKGFFD